MNKNWQPNQKFEDSLFYQPIICDNMNHIIHFVKHNSAFEGEMQLTF